MNIKEIVKEISNLKMIDMVELLEEIKKVFKLKTEIQNKKEYKCNNNDIIIKSIGENKIQTIKYIKEITKKNLIECKKITENLPYKLLENVTNDEIEKIKKKLLELKIEHEIIKK